MTRKTRHKGKVIFVGAGPGDAGLLTIRGAEELASADLVVYDWLVNPDLLELAPRAEKVYAGKALRSRAVKSTGKKSRGSAGLRYVEQQETNRILLRAVRGGKKVVRLKGGDSFIFGRGGEEAAFLKNHGVCFEIVPGVSAGHAVPAFAGIPLTDRGEASQIVFFTGHEDPAKDTGTVNWEKLAAIRGTLVGFMAVRNLKRITEALCRGGMKASVPACVIEWGTLPVQRVIEATVGTIAAKAAKASIAPPSLLVIGNVVRLRRKLDWLGRKPLAGKTVVLTRPEAQSSGLRQSFQRAGAQVLECPSVEIAPPADTKPLDRALKCLGDFDWMIFTSVNAVDHVFRRLDALGFDSRRFYRTRIAAIGTTTAEALRDRGIRADLIPERFTSEGLIAAFRRAGIRGHSFLLARTDIAPEFLPEKLRQLGASVTQVVAYRTLPARGNREKLSQFLRRADRIDYLTFTSPSTAEFFFRSVPASRQLRASRIVSIGPVTSRAIRKLGWRVHHEAVEHTAAGLLREVTRAAASKRKRESEKG